MEKEIVINTSDGHKIYGFLKLPKKNSDKLIIFTHGFTGTCNEHIFFNGSKFFKTNGIATFRFDLYTWKSGGRSLLECSLKDHVNDLKTVYDYFKDKYPKIYLIGHSFGGIIALKANLPAEKIILWDSAHKKALFIEECEYNKSLDVYQLNWGIIYLIGKKIYNDAMNMPTPEELMANINVPIKIICAGNGELIKGSKEYYNLAKDPKEFAIVKNASHSFDEEGAEEKLFKESLDWIDKF